MSLPSSAGKVLDTPPAEVALSFSQRELNGDYLIVVCAKPSKENKGSITKINM